MNGVIRKSPAVFAVGDTYQIIVLTDIQTTMWIKIGDNCYYDEINGVMKSDALVHKIKIPASELNNAKKYTVCFRKILKREPYFTQMTDVCEQDYDFYPPEGDDLVAYHISDTHGMIEEPLSALNYFGKQERKIDFLILNGDIVDYSDDIELFENAFEIISRATGGHLPVVYARGNHDTRGKYAEKTIDYFPENAGRTYFTFRLGKIWGIVLDCGEDKDDSSREYGNTACFHGFRLKETEFIEKVIHESKNEYEAEGVLYRVIVVHIPFTRKYNPPFNIEEDLYSYWAKMLKERIKPNIMICGHKHVYSIDKPGEDNDGLGQPCTVVVGSAIDINSQYYGGSGYTFADGKIKITFNNGEKIIETHTVK